MIPNSELSGYYLVELRETTITAGVAVRVEGVSLVYVAYSGAIAVVSYSVLLVYCDHIFILFIFICTQFNITQTGFFTKQKLEDAVATHPVSSPVRDLQWSEGTEHIIVTTDEMVKAQHYKYYYYLYWLSQYLCCNYNRYSN